MGAEEDKKTAENIFDFLSIDEKEEQEQEQEIVTEENVSEEVQEEEVDKEEETVEEEVVETDETKEKDETEVDEITSLRNRIEELSGKATPVVESEPEENLNEVIPEELDFDALIGEDFSEFLDSRESFVALLKAVTNQAADSGRTKAVKQIMNALPAITMNYIQQQSTITGLVKDFYRENADLVPFKKTVGGVANEIASANPDWDHKKVFDEVAVKTREILGLAKGGKKTERIANQETSLKKPGTSNRRTAVPESKLQKDINDLLGG